MDVVETPAGIELVIDVPGIPESALTIGFSQGTLFVAGRKSAGACAHRRRPSTSRNAASDASCVRSA